MSTSPEETVGLVRARRQSGRPKFRGMVKGGRLVYAPTTWEAGDIPPWPARALHVNADGTGSIVWVD